MTQKKTHCNVRLCFQKEQRPLLSLSLDVNIAEREFRPPYSIFSNDRFQTDKRQPDNCSIQISLYYFRQKVQAQIKVECENCQYAKKRERICGNPSQFGEKCSLLRAFFQFAPLLVSLLDVLQTLTQDGMHVQICQRVYNILSLAAEFNQPALLEHAQLMRDRALRHAQRLRDFGHAHTEF